MGLGSGAKHRRIEVVEVAVNRPGRDMHLGASAEGERSRLVWSDLTNELKATKKVTTILCHGSFGLVYKAITATGEVMAEKVLATPLLLGARRTQGIGCRPCSPGGPLVMHSIGRVVRHSR